MIVVRVDCMGDIQETQTDFNDDDVVRLTLWMGAALAKTQMAVVAGEVSIGHISITMTKQEGTV